jgi:hypothetical protein
MGWILISSSFGGVAESVLVSMALLTPAVVNVVEFVVAEVVAEAVAELVGDDSEVRSDVVRVYSAIVVTIGSLLPPAVGSMIVIVGAGRENVVR